MAEAFERFAGIDLLATLDAAGDADREALAAAAPGAGIAVAADDTWSDLFSRVLVEKIEPQLGLGRGRPSSTSIRSPRRRWRGRSPAIRAWPSGSSSMPAAWSWPTASASSPTRPSSAAGSRPRWRRSSGSTASAIRSTRISSPRWRMMPPASGIALGFDRLVMLALGAPTIEHVLWAPVPLSASASPG